MIDVNVLIGFACCRCDHTMEVELKCEGQGLADHAVKAVVAVSCPSCRQTNQVIFSPETGEVIDVMRSLIISRIPEFSLN